MARIATERIQGGCLYPVDEPVRLSFQPGLVYGAGAANDGVEEPGVEASGLVTRQIDHDRDRPVEPDPRRPPDVLVDAERLDSRQPRRVTDASLGFDLNRVPAGMPVHPQMPSQRRNGGVVVAERVDSPAHRSDREDRPRRRLVVGLTERAHQTRRLAAAPDPHQPANYGNSAEARRVMQLPDPTTMADREHAAQRAAMLQPAGLHRKHQPRPLVDLDIENVHVGSIEDRIGPGAPARTRATHRVRHRRVLRESVAWSLLILKGPTSSLPDQHADPKPGITHAQIRRV
jgi:hypothetical protein